MPCIAPPELSEQQLLAYTDGVADEQVAMHLSRCTYCRERADQMARLEDRLTARLYRLTCPRSEELGEYHLDLLDPDRAAEIQQHLLECPYCTREVLQLENYLRVLAPTIEYSPIERVKVMIARLVGEHGEARRSGRQEFAPVLAGIRGEAKGPITLEADGILVVLDVQPADEERVTILGQVAADDQDRWTGAVVELRRTGELQMTVTVDDLGAFRCEAWSPGPTEILITPSSGDPVLIPDIEIVV